MQRLIRHQKCCLVKITGLGNVSDFDGVISFYEHFYALPTLKTVGKVRGDYSNVAEVACPVVFLDGLANCHSECFKFAISLTLLWTKVDLAIHVGCCFLEVGLTPTI